MMVSPTSRSSTNLAIPSTSVAPNPVLMAIAPMAALPGAQNTVRVSGLCRAFQVSACSRAPLPTTRTFTPRPDAPPQPGREKESSFPLDGRRRLGGDVVDDPVHAWNL